MNKRLKFEVVDIVPVSPETDSGHFTVMEMKIVSSGMNLHRLPIKEKAINIAAQTLYGKPVLAYYDERTGKLKGHDEDEIPIGVFLDSKPRIEREGDKLWMYAKAYIWKMYFPHIVELFKRDNGRTNISMEIEVLETTEEKDGFQWINQFAFLGVTAIGVTPAIVGSGGNVIQFSEMVDKAVREFSGRYDGIDFRIPQAVKDNVRDGLKLHEQGVAGALPQVLADARYILNNEQINPERVSKMAAFFLKKKEPEEMSSRDGMIWLLRGGNDASAWLIDLQEKIKACDDDKLSARFEKAEAKEDTTLKKNEEKFEEKEEGLKGEEFEVTTPEAKEEKEETKEEEKEGEAEETKDEAEDVKMSLDAYADVPAMLSYLEQETEEQKQMMAELSKPEQESDFSRIASGMYQMLMEFSNRLKETSEKLTASEGAIREYREKEFSLRVDEFISELSQKVKLTDEQIGIYKEKAKTFSLDTLAEWEKSVKVELFDVLSLKGESDRKSKEPIFIPSTTVTTKTNSIW